MVMTVASDDIQARIALLVDTLVEASARSGLSAERRRELQNAVAFVKTLDQLPALQAKLSSFEAQLAALAAQPLQFGVFLRPAPGPVSGIVSEERLTSIKALDDALRTAIANTPASGERDRLESTREWLVSLLTEQQHNRIIVGFNGQEYEVSLAAPDLTVSGFQQGQRVLLNKMLNVVAAHSTYLRGDTAEVVNVLSPPGTARILALPNDSSGLRVQGPDGAKQEAGCDAALLPALKIGDVVELDADGRVIARIKPRLHVRSGGTEGIVVEVSDRLFEDGVAIGDIVRVDTQLRFAFEKLPSYETGGLALEEVPDIDYDDIGGLDSQIREIRDTIELPYLHRALFDRYRLTRPRGILLHGPPGCGKTMIAKAVANNLTKSIRQHLEDVLAQLGTLAALRANPADATARAAAAAVLGEPLLAQSGDIRAHFEAALRERGLRVDRLDEERTHVADALGRTDGVRSFFLNVKGPELLNKYVGETEHRIRKIFEEAKRRATFATPVVIFFDEMEAMFRARGSGLSSDVETTIVPQFLAEMDGVEASANVIVIGASNRPELIDAAVLRPGRLDAKIAVGQPDREAARAILALHVTPDIPLYDNGRRFSGTGDIAFKPAVTRRTLETIAPGVTASVLDDLVALLPDESDLRKASGRATAFDAACVDAGISSQALDEGRRREWIAEDLIAQALTILYSPSSRIEAVLTAGERLIYPLREFIGGAVLVNIVMRAKKAAVVREATAATLEHGLTEDDLLGAIHDEFAGSASQLAAVRAERDPFIKRGPGIPPASVQVADVHLGGLNLDPWSVDKVLVEGT